MKSLSPNAATVTSADRQIHQADERVRLLKFVTVFGVGGTERHFVDLGLALDSARFALEYGCLKKWGEFLHVVEARGIPCVEYAMRPLASLRAVWQELRLARDMARRRTQIVHTYSFFANMFGVVAAWLAGVPVIVASIRDRGVSLSRVQRQVQRLVCKLADCVLVNTESIKEWLISDGYDPLRIAVIRNGLDVPRFGGPRNPMVRSGLGLPEGAPIVAIVSRLTPMKGIEDFIDAAAIVSWNRPDARFLIVGAGHAADHDTFSSDLEYRQSLEDRVRRLGLEDRVLLTGYRADIVQVLSEVTVSVLPSLSEGLSNAVLEAMAAGLPVVATRVGGTPEAVEDGVTGLLVPPSDPQALATAIAEVLADPVRAAAMGAAGRQTVRARFGMERMVRATEQLYLDLLVRKAAQPGFRRRIGLGWPIWELGRRS